ncbi:MAG: hypothetical protein U1E10_01520, partial [Bdellovibrionales bacterium]|nr:hypothetical protein [Bdellovibrionales bacterium]
MKTKFLLPSLLTAFAIPLAASSAQAYGGDAYINDAQARLKPGVYQGKVGRGQDCTVRVNLEK